jgi:hypothetical protein
MKPLLTVVLGFICGSILVYGQSDGAQDQKSGGAQIVSTAEIVKVDAKKKTLQVREVAQPRASRDDTSRRSPGSGGRRPGGGGRGGVGFPGGGGRRPGGAPRTVEAKEYKVFVSGDTVYKFAQATIDFSDLHVGDRITVSGTPKGGKGDIDAKTIVRE